MTKRIAALLAMSVIAFQALTGVAGAVTSSTTGGFGDPYDREVDDDSAPADGLCAGSETLELYIYDGEFGCDADYANSDSLVLFSEVDQPLEVLSGGNLVINLTDDSDDVTAGYRGLEMEIQVGGTIIIVADDDVFTAEDYAGDADKGVKLTVKQDGFVGMGLDNAKVLNADTVQFYGTDYADTFDASALTVDIPTRDDDYGIGGEDGNDILKGGAGDDDINGGNDKDTIYGNAGDDDELNGDSGNDVVYGGAGNDYIYCDGSNDTEQCWGNEGDDDIEIRSSGGSSDVTVAPGDGADFLDFAQTGNNVTLYFGDMTKAHSLTLDPVNGNDKCEASDFGEDTAQGDCSDIQTIVGTGFDDVFDVSAIDDNTGDDMVIAGGAGNDILVGPGGGDSIVLSGGSGNDRLFDGGADDSVALLGSTGNDRLVGGSGWNYMSGGPGKDKVFAGGDADIVSAGRGDDLAYGEAGGDDIAMGAGNDLAFGGDDDDTLAGAKGADRLSSGLGDDSADGGAGNDQLHGDGGNDQLTGGPGYDRTWGDGDDYDAMDDPFVGDYCSGEVVAGCEWQLAVGPSGPYWVKLA